MTITEYSYKKEYIMSHHTVRLPRSYVIPSIYPLFCWHDCTKSYRRIWL